MTKILVGLLIVGALATTAYFAFQNFGPSSQDARSHEGPILSGGLEETFDEEPEDEEILPMDAQPTSSPSTQTITPAQPENERDRQELAEEEKEEEIAEPDEADDDDSVEMARREGLPRREPAHRPKAPHSRQELISRTSPQPSSTASSPVSSPPEEPQPSSSPTASDSFGDTFPSLPATSTTQPSSTVRQTTSTTSAKKPTDPSSSKASESSEETQQKTEASPTETENTFAKEGEKTEETEVSEAVASSRGSEEIPSTRATWPQRAASEQPPADTAEIVDPQEKWLRSMKIPEGFKGFKGLTFSPKSIQATSTPPTTREEREEPILILGATWKSSFDEKDTPTLKILKECPEEDPAGAGTCDPNAVPPEGPALYDYFYKGSSHREDLVPESTESFEIGTVIIGLTRESSEDSEKLQAEAAFHLSPGSIPGKYRVVLTGRTTELEASFEVTPVTEDLKDPAETGPQ